jgi:nucleoside-diphosphate-sugar epimerase
MNVVMFGATGMIGQGVLRECLIDPGVERVLSVGRAATGRGHPKLRDLVHLDFSNFSAIANDMTGYDACFFCLGVSSAGMTEPDYRRVTYDIPVAAAAVLVAPTPG